MIFNYYLFYFIIVLFDKYFNKAASLIINIWKNICPLNM